MWHVRGKRELRAQGLCFEGKSKRGHLEDLVVEGRVSKWILNRMRVRRLDLTASGKEVESTCEHTKEVTIRNCAETCDEKLITFLQKNHVPAPYLFNQSVS